MTTWSWIKFFWFQDHEINFHQRILKKVCKTYDVNIREAVHNNFWWNLKQLPRVLKSNYSKRFLKIPEKSFVSSFSNVLSVDRKGRYFKYTSGRLLLDKHWISRKWCQYLFLLMFLTLVIKRSLYFSLFPDCLRLISVNFCRKFYQGFSGTWVFSASWTLTNVKKQLFQANFLSSLFNSCLMLKVFKLQIISDRNANKKISHKNYLKLSQDNPSWKSRLKKLDLSCGIDMYNFGGLLQCAK